MRGKIILVLLFCIFTGVIFCTESAKAETDPEIFVCLETLTGHSDMSLLGVEIR